MLIYWECDKTQKGSSEKKFNIRVEQRENGARVHLSNMENYSDNVHNQSSTANEIADALMAISTLYTWDSSLCLRSLDTFLSSL